MRTYKIQRHSADMACSELITDPKDRSIFEVYVTACNIINNGIEVKDANRMPPMKYLLNHLVNQGEGFKSFAVALNDGKPPILIDKDAVSIALKALDNKMWEMAAERYLNESVFRGVSYSAKTKFLDKIGIYSIFSHNDKIREAMIRLGLTNKQVDLIFDYDRMRPIISLKRYQQNIALKTFVNPDALLPSLEALSGEIESDEHFKNIVWPYLDSWGSSHTIDFINLCKLWSDYNKSTQECDKYADLQIEQKVAIVKMCEQANKMIESGKMRNEDLDDVLSIKAQLQFLAGHEKFGDGFSIPDTHINSSINSVDGFIKSKLK